jgi:hypothetical protein
MLLSASRLFLLLLLGFTVIGQGIAGFLPIVASAAAAAAAAAAAHSQCRLDIPCPCLPAVSVSFLPLLGRIFLLLLALLPFLKHHVRVHPTALATVVLGQGVVVMVGVCVCFWNRVKVRGREGRRCKEGAACGKGSGQPGPGTRGLNTDARTGWTIAQDVDQALEDGGRHIWLLRGGG